MKKLVLFGILTVLVLATNAQMAITTDGSDAHPSAMLEVKSSNKGMLIPRVSLAAIIQNPAQGLLVYQTSNPEGFYYFSSSGWKLIGTGSASNPSEETSLTQSGENIIMDGGTFAINTFSPHPSAALDIYSTTQGVLMPRMTENQMNTITSPAKGLIIFNTDTNTLEIFDGSEWKSVCSGCTSGGTGSDGNSGGNSGNTGNEPLIPPKITTAERDNISSPENGMIIYNTTIDDLQIYKNGAWTNLVSSGCSIFGNPGFSINANNISVSGNTCLESGAEITLTASQNGNWKDAEYLWTKPDGTTSANQSLPVFTLNSSSTGFYSCKITNAFAAGCHYTKSVNLMAGPKITTNIYDFEMCSNNPKTLSITAEGSNFAYQWQKSNDNGINWINITNESVYSGASTNNLTINNGSTISGTLYRVIINSTCQNQIKSNEVKLSYRSECYMKSCLEYYNSGKTTDGQYIIDPDGINGSISPYNVTCLMSISGGGWTYLGNYTGTAKTYKWYTHSHNYNRMLIKMSGSIRCHCNNDINCCNSVGFKIGSSLYSKPYNFSTTTVGKYFSFGNENATRAKYQFYVGDGEKYAGGGPLYDNCGSFSTHIWVK